jgi:HEPN domain-containing protein
MEFLKQYKLLFKKSKSDFKAGKILLKDFENGDNELDISTIMFHFQQSTEKLLKALLSYNQKHFTKTHDIKELIRAINKNNIDIISDIDKLMPLTEYAVEGRYAIIQDDIEDTDKYIDILEKLTLHVEKIIFKEED